MTKHPGLLASRKTAIFVLLLGVALNSFFWEEDFSQAIVLGVGFIFFNFRAWVALGNAFVSGENKTFIKSLMVNKILAISLVIAALVLLPESGKIAFLVVCLTYSSVGVLFWKYLSK